MQTTFTKDANTAGLWLFKEGTGTTTANEVSGMPVGTFQSAAWAMGRQYYAVATDAGYLQILYNAAIVPSSAITVEAWIKVQQSAGYLICNNGSFTISMGGPLSVTLWLSGGSITFSGATTVPTGQWVHVAMTYSSSTGTACIYLNGNLDGQATGSGTLSEASYHPNIRVGQNDWSSIGSEMDGKVDSLRISNIARVFTPLYSPSPGTSTPPGNLVPNGDFEAGLMGWRLNGYGDMNLVWEATSGAATGQQCACTLSTAVADYATAPGGGSPPPLISRPIPAHPGRHYTFSCRLKTVGSNLYPQIGVYQCGGPSDIAALWSGSPFPIYPTVTTSWSQVTQAFTLPSTFSAPSMCVSLGYPSSGQQLYVDDVRLIAGDGPNILALKDKITVGPQTVPIGNTYVYNAFLADDANHLQHGYRRPCCDRAADHHGLARDVGFRDSISGHGHGACRRRQNVVL